MEIDSTWNILKQLGKVVPIHQPVYFQNIAIKSNHLCGRLYISLMDQLVSIKSGW
jgi:hypothetical protein